jgi:hypothetical protein
MKRIGLLLCAFSFFAMSGFAQASSNASERADKRVQAISAIVTLSADQATQVKAVFVDAFTKIDQLKQNRSNREEVTAQRREIMQQAHTQLQNILTEAQMDKIRESRKNERGDRNR